MDQSKTPPPNADLGRNIPTMELLAPAGDEAALLAALEAGAAAVYFGLAQPQRPAEGQEFQPAGIRQGRRYGPRPRHRTGVSDLEHRLRRARTGPGGADVGTRPAMPRRRRLRARSGAHGLAAGVSRVGVPSKHANVHGQRRQRGRGRRAGSEPRGPRPRNEPAGNRRRFAFGRANRGLRARRTVFFGLGPMPLVELGRRPQRQSRGLYGPYRRFWAVEEQSAGTPLSMKDLSLIDRLAELRQAGVTGLKIEGRLKNAAWVRRAVGLYRKALDSGLEGSAGKHRRGQSPFRCAKSGQSPRKLGQSPEDRLREEAAELGAYASQGAHQRLFRRPARRADRHCRPRSLGRNPGGKLGGDSFQGIIRGGIFGRRK